MIGQPDEYTCDTLSVFESNYRKADRKNSYRFRVGKEDINGIARIFTAVQDVMFDIRSGNYLSDQTLWLTKYEPSKELVLIFELVDWKQTKFQQVRFGLPAWKKGDINYKHERQFSNTLSEITQILDFLIGLPRNKECKYDARYNWGTPGKVIIQVCKVDRTVSRNNPEPLLDSFQKDCVDSTIQSSNKALSTSTRNAIIGGIMILLALVL
jgi:hypothetical protein